MNKKLKFMSSVLCGVLLASNLGVTSVCAKTIKNDSPNQISETVKGETEFEAKIYQEKDGEIIELTDKDLAKMNLKIDRKTLEVRKIRQKRDIDEGSYFEDYKHVSHEEVQKICNYMDEASIASDVLADHGDGIMIQRLNTNHQILTITSC